MSTIDPTASTPWEREGVGHSFYAFRDALTNFAEARASTDRTVVEEQTKCGIASLAHAWYVAVTSPERLPPDEARDLFNELCRLAGTWE